MTSRFALLISTILVCPALVTAAVPFLKELSSPFPSGIQSKAKLQKNIVDSFTKTYHFVKNKKVAEAWFLEDEIFSWKSLASEVECQSKAAFFTGRNEKLKPKSFCEKGEILEILEHQNTRFRVRTPKAKIFWVEDRDVSWKLGSPGKVLLKRDSYLLELKTGQKIWLKAPVKLALVRYHKDEIFVRFNNKLYQASRNKFISPLDLAVAIHFKSGKTYPFQIVGSELQVNNKKFGIPSNPRLSFDSHKFYVLAGTPIYHFAGNKYIAHQKLASPDLFFSLRFKEERWFQSRVKNHGLVYWRDYKHVHQSEILSDELFFEREVYDIASSPLDREIMFASAGGLFRKVNKNQWEPIERFKGKNYPIHFAKKGRLFVGAYHSDDHGRTFKAFIPFHKLVKKVKDKRLLTGSNYRVTSIKSLDDEGSKIELEISDGLKSLKVGADLNLQTWTLIP